ncbi:hypothetical protein HW115_12050 [Verrucomicrobiaceae bacterium N1E253]|uniref:PA14 domain-containing protein n=1 Tax=Oceaniferula marina TaxID=2748318 RepID=A0A851GG43_9BACT|nr:hypothetical protein [Oceaniferula marina]NWK56346.1 hypothetical protein [Oceaniferula marina]
MSLHARLSPEVLRRLESQQRNSTIASILISILSLLLVGIILLWVLLPPIENFTPEIVSYHANSEEPDPVQKREMTRNVERKPSSPSSSIAKVIAAKVEAVTAIPIPDNVNFIPSLDFGDGDDFGEGWGDGFGSGSGGGFGSASKIDGSISGYLYDFKQDRHGKAVSGYNIQTRSHFTDPINRLHRSRFSQPSLAKFYKADQNLYLRYVAIPFSNASDGPRFFQAEEEVKPSGWIAHYNGRVTAPKSGTFRFVGAGDDYLSVHVDRKFRLVAAWSDIQGSVTVRGANASDAPVHRSAIGAAPLTYGSWFTVRKGQELDIGITLGERPGGKVGFMLMLEEKGAHYRETAEGRKILPPFTMGPLSPEDLDNLEKFPGWEWEFVDVPVFKARD